MSTARRRDLLCFIYKTVATAMGETEKTKSLFARFNTISNHSYISNILSVRFINKSIRTKLSTHVSFRIQMLALKEIWPRLTECEVPTPEFYDF